MPAPHPSPRQHLFGLVTLVVVAALSAGARIETAVTSSKFDVESAVGQVPSDPGLLFYLTERVVEAGGGAPEDLRADPRIEHPERVDVPGRYTVGLEWLVAWGARLLGRDVPLHLACVWITAILASLTAVGVYGLAFELTRSPPWAALAVVLWGTLPASYRTIGFVLVREDLSLPLYAAHLWLAARALRRRTFGSAALAGLALGLALATWHATTFLATLEGLALFAWFLRSDREPFDAPRAWALLAGVALVCLSVPALWQKGAVLGPPLQLAGGLAVAGILVGHSRAVRAAAALGGAVLLFVLARLAAHGLGTAADFGHVVDVVWAKASHLGVLPRDPAALSFEARMMWQGPFATLTVWSAVGYLQLGLLLLAPLVVVDHLRFLAGRREDAGQVLHLFLLLALVAAWLVERSVVLVALLLPVAFAAGAQRFVGPSRSAVPRLALASVLFLQLVAFGSWLGRFDLPWHSVARREALRALVAEVAARVPEEQAVAADFMTSTEVLAHTRRPIVLQPKWETHASRERVRLFWQAFYHGTPDDLRRLLVEQWDCRHLAVDRRTLWWLNASRYLAGYAEREREPRPGTAAEALLRGRGAEGWEPVEGYELLWSGPEQAGPDGMATDAIRLFRLQP